MLYFSVSPLKVSSVAPDGLRFSFYKSMNNATFHIHNADNKNIRQYRLHFVFFFKKACF